jgi:hypothetical protein
MSVDAREPGGRVRPSDPDDALFNEAYLGILIALAVRNFNDKSSGKPMPWLLAFIVVPLVIHAAVRDRLPGSTRTRFSSWIADQPLVYAGFGDRALAVAPYARRAMRYALRSGVVMVDGEGLRSNISPTRYTRLAGDDAKEAGKQAAFLGRWFAAIEDVPSIFGQLGVEP